MDKTLDTLRLALEALRLEAEGRIEAIVAELPEWKEWARHVPGVGALSLGKLLGLVGNPAARPLFSSLARHCGVAVVDGKVEKPSKGQNMSARNAGGRPNDRRPSGCACGALRKN
jgi:hypothetical protein